MKTIVTTLALFTGLCLSAQTQMAQVEFTETIKMEIKDGPEGMDLSGFFPESISNHKTLVVNKNESIYRDSKKQEAEEPMEMESDDGSFKISIMRDDTEEILYLNLSDKVSIHQKNLMGKSFVVKGDASALKWKIGTEKISYLGYECTKATAKTEDDKPIVAWFTSQIPVQSGPGSFNGLPGLILMISIEDGKRELKATSVSTQNVDTSVIKVPKDGKKTTAAEFKKIEEEKMKEFEEKYSGGNSFIFKN